MIVEELPIGLQQRVEILKALSHDAELLILDEPTNGLDVESTHLFYDIVLDEAKKGTTVLFSTHLMDHVEKLCSHVVIINQGSVVCTGPLDELRSEFGLGVSLEDLFLKLTLRSPQS